METMRLKILVVDDERHIANTLKKGLERAGHYVIVAHNKIDALRMVKREGCDLMVLDDLMVDAFGAEVVHELRALEDGRDLPLIIYFCHYGEHDRDQLAQDWKDAGTIAQFAKPFYPWDLLEEVAGHVAEFVKQRIDKKQFAASASQPE